MKGTVKKTQAEVIAHLSRQVPDIDELMRETSWEVNPKYLDYQALRKLTRFFLLMRKFIPGSLRQEIEDHLYKVICSHHPEARVQAAKNFVVMYRELKANKDNISKLDASRFEAELNEWLWQAGWRHAVVEHHHPWMVAKAIHYREFVEHCRYMVRLSTEQQREFREGDRVIIPVWGHEKRGYTHKCDLPFNRGKKHWKVHDAYVLYSPSGLCA